MGENCRGGRSEGWQLNVGELANEGEKGWRLGSAASRCGFRFGGFESPVRDASFLYFFLGLVSLGSQVVALFLCFVDQIRLFGIRDYWSRTESNRQHMNSLIRACSTLRLSFESCLRSLKAARRLAIGRWGCAIPALLLTVCAIQGGGLTFPEIPTLPTQSEMPDPLVTLDGRRVNSRQQWIAERRPELKALFQHFMYGSIPPTPAHPKTRMVGQYPDFLDGKATLKLVTLETGPTNAPRIDLMMVVPNEVSAPTPPLSSGSGRRPPGSRPAVFLVMNFCGNHALAADPRIPLAHGWLGSGCPGCSNNIATAAGRGAQATNWPLAEIVRRGYALATFYSGDIDPDRKDASSGIYAWLAGDDPVKNQPANRGTIAAWAWGFQRCVDYLVVDSDVDPKRIAALGHSRNGKTALLAAAFDERIAVVFPHQAGCGGSAPSRSKTGESVKAINDKFPHWFNARFKQFNDAPERLPFDQNCLVALCAPRPVLFTAATGDQWANPAGQFEVLKAADGVYRLLGTEGLGAKEMPPIGRLVDTRLGYYIREGKHSMTPEDWTVFMNFADRRWGVIQTH